VIHFSIQHFLLSPSLLSSGQCEGTPMRQTQKDIFGWHKARLKID
jgi:hypothetical protein